MDCSTMGIIVAFTTLRQELYKGGNDERER